jgi:hypothetical protein
VSETSRRRGFGTRRSDLARHVSGAVGAGLIALGLSSPDARAVPGPDTRSGGIEVDLSPNIGSGQNNPGMLEPTAPAGGPESAQSRDAGPQRARLTDGSREVVAPPGNHLVDITGWDLQHLAVVMPAATFTLSAVAISTPADGGRPLLTQASFMVRAEPDAASMPSGTLQTVQADASQDQIAVRAATEPGSEPAGGEALTGSTGPGASTAEALVADHKMALERERTRTEILAQELAKASEEVSELKSKLAAAAGERTGEPRTPGSEALPPPRASEALPREVREPEPGHLLARADGLLLQGDISGARLVLERAVAEGSPVAAFLLAQTYDPRLLRSWNVRGIGADPDKARELYGKAAQAGVSRARDMVEAMH